ncbi:MAG: putative toxin-antitoxin system toxin component, PIN family [Steroidobacteraceae bacterium]
MRLVLDTNSVVSALLRQGPPHQLIFRSSTLPLLFLSSPVLLDELEEVLGYSKLSKAVATTLLTPAQVRQRYQRIVIVVEPATVPPTVLADPDDDHVIACAVAAKADMIVSGDSHLLALKKHQNIPILRVTDALDELNPTRAHGR